MKAEDRRREILDILAESRQITAPEVAEKFHVSRRTAVNDLQIIERSDYPIYAVQGHDGGYKVMEGCQIYRRTLKSKEENLLRKILSEPRSEEEREILKGIIKAFSTKRFL